MKARVALLGGWSLAVSVLLVLSETAGAGKIIWRSLSRPHVTSEGNALTGAMVFELGVFADGFVPTVTNIDSWDSQWRSAASTTFNVSESRFSATHTVTSNEAPFMSGVRGYIWGREGDEWILMTGSDWHWPDDDPLVFSATWSTLTADVVIVGATSTDRSESHVQTFRISDRISPDEWRERYFSDADFGGWLADPDGDGLTNQLEYGLGLHPRSDQAEDRFPLEIERGQETMVLRLPRSPNRGVLLDLEYSHDLISWSNELPEGWTLLEDHALGMGVQMGDGQREVFVRIRARW